MITRRSSPIVLLERVAHTLAFVAAMLTALTPRTAWAHAHLVKSAPVGGSHIQLSPRGIQLWYSEAADPTLTTVSIAGPNGVQISTGKLVADANNPLLLSTPLNSTLQPGLYTVTWHAIAKDDGHPSHGTFVFTVDGSAIGVVSATTHTDGALPGAAGPKAPVAAQPETGSLQWTDVEAPGYIVARWLTFAGLIGTLGVVCFVLLVVPGVAVDGDPARVVAFREAVRRRAATLGLAAALVTVVASVWRLYAERSVIGGAVTIGTLLQSFWGHVWLIQFILTALLCAAFALARGERSGKAIGPAWPVAAIAALLLGATPAFSGHAAAAMSHRALSIGLDIVHVIAAGGWLGGLFVLAVAGIPATLTTRANTESGETLPLIARLVNAFSPRALTLAVLVALTGAIAAWLHVGSFAVLFHSVYGTVLLVKLGCVALVLAAGGHNWLRMRAELAADTGGSAVGSFRRSAWSEIAFAAMVIAATAVLVAVQPPLH